MRNFCFLLLCFSMASASMAQTTITPKIGFGRVNLTYVYDNATYKEKKVEAVGIALALDRELKGRLGIHTELGLHAFTNTLNIKPATTYISGYHHYQQAYMSIAPQYTFAEKPVQPFVHAGLTILVDTKNELADYDSTIPMDGGFFTPRLGSFITVGVRLSLGKMNILWEFKNAFQRDVYDRSSGIYRPAQLKMHRMNIFFGLGYPLG